MCQLESKESESGGASYALRESNTYSPNDYSPRENSYLSKITKSLVSHSRGEMYN